MPITSFSSRRVRALSRAISRSSFPLFDKWDHSDRMRELSKLLQSQYWTAAQHEANSVVQLNRVLAHAHATIPYYRETWKQLPVLGHSSDLSQLPLLTKTDIRGAEERLISKNVDPAALITAKTGGSTGTSLFVKFDHQCQQHRNAAALRSDSWAGWRPGDWTGALWGSPERPANFKQKLRNLLRDRLEFLDTMRLDAASMTEFLQRMRAKPFDALFGHAHSLFILADFKLNSGISVPAPHAIVSTSMMLLAHERVAIELAFNCPVTDRYGCEEVGLIAAECEAHRGYHVNSEHTFVEIVDDSGKRCLPGEIGRVLVTDLQNVAMPLIRYEVGDLSAWAQRACSCARGLPTLERIVGRQADCLQRMDGSLAAGVSLVERTLLDIQGIAQLQLVQTSPTRLIAYMVPDIKTTDKTAQDLAQALERDLGKGLTITVETVERLAQEKNGKYRFAIRKF